MENKKKGNIFIALFIIVLILLIAETVFLVISLNKKENNVENTDTEVIEQIDETEKEDPIIELSVEDEIVKTLYDYIPQYGVNLIIKNAYQSKKTTIADIDNEVLLSFAFRKVTIPDEAKELMEGTTLPGGWYKFDASYIQNEAIKLFGQEIPNQTFSVGAGSGCKYEDDGRYYYTSGGGSGSGSNSYRKILKAYKQGDYIYIEDKYMYYVGIGGIVGMPDAGCYLYDTSDKANLIAKADTLEELGENLIEKYYDQMKTYKHTFAKAEDGSYYWVSTEPIE